MFTRSGTGEQSPVVRAALQIHWLRADFPHARNHVTLFFIPVVYHSGVWALHAPHAGEKGKGPVQSAVAGMPPVERLIERELPTSGAPVLLYPHPPVIGHDAQGTGEGNSFQ